MSARLSIRSAFQPSSANAAERTVDVVWTTGARVLRTFPERHYEELSLRTGHVRLARLNSGAPLLDNHRYDSLDAVIGVVERGSVLVNGASGKATVRFARAEDDEFAGRLFRMVLDGIFRNCSVGYRVYRYEKHGGRDVPIFRAVDWEPFEISLVAVGADAGAGVRSEADADRERRLRLAKLRYVFD